MTTLAKLTFNNTFSRLNKDLYSHVTPQGLEKPFLVSANPLAATLIGLDSSELYTQAFVDIFSGNQLLEQSAPLAMIYSGHQFGAYNPQLGDGRGLLLGEVASEQHGKWDLHLKGAGKTPYSRFADGRAVLRSSIREYLCSEAMAGLDIPTTRALCIMGSQTPVYRERVETGAMVLRLAKSHIRFGHFEYFHYNQRPDIVKQLADYTIAQQYPEVLDTQAPYVEFFKAIIKRTAILIANWQAVGFAHGVMNTDNMSIVGDTFDYGPYGFLDDYEPEFICNHSDHQGRYAFDRQPAIGLWNLNALAHGLSSLIEREQLSAALSTYEKILVETYTQLMQKKLGLQTVLEEDHALLSTLLQLLEKNSIDYTYFFRQLCYSSESSESSESTLRDLFVDNVAFDHWLQQYQSRLNKEPDNRQRKQHMLSTNPKYTLRNYLAQKAISLAESEKDYSEVNTLLKLVQSPFDEHPDYDAYAKPPPDSGKKLEISCSS